jgi:hypothetical protein
MPSSTKWKVVPPGRSQGSRFSCVTTKTGVWNGSSSGHACSPRSKRALAHRAHAGALERLPDDVVVAPFLDVLAELQAARRRTALTAAGVIA